MAGAVTTAHAMILSEDSPVAILGENGYWVSPSATHLDVINSGVLGNELQLEQEVVISDRSQSLSISGTDFLSSGHSELGHNDVIYAEGVSIESGQVWVSTLSSSVKDTEPKVLVRGSEGVVLELGNGSVLSGGELGRFNLVGNEVVVDGEAKFCRGTDVLKIAAGNTATLKNTKAYAEYALDMDGATLVLEDAEVQLGNAADKTTVAEVLINNVNNDKNLFVIHVGKDAAEKLNLQSRPTVNAHIMGTGKLMNVNMLGGKLQVGLLPDNRLGVLAIEQVEAGYHSGTDSSPEWNFTLATDADYDFQATNTVSNGKFSQLKPIGHTNHADNVEITFNYIDNNGVTDKNALNEKFKYGASLTLIDTTEGSVSGTYVLDIAGLPNLEEGLTWYTNDLFKNGTITVVDAIWHDLSLLSGDDLISFDDVYDIIENNQVADSSRLANTMLVAGDTAGRFGRTAVSHVDDYRKNDTNMWGSAFFHKMNVDGSGRRTGFDSDTLGYAVGADTRLKRHNAIVGVALGTSYGDIKPSSGNYTYSAGKIEQDGVHLGVYGRLFRLPRGYEEHSLRVDAYLSYGMYDCKSNRTAKGNGQNFRACWDEDAWAMGVTVSRDYQWRYGTIITPYAGLEYTMADMEGLREMGYTSVDYSCTNEYRNLSVLAGARAHRSLSLRNGQVLIPYASATMGLDALHRNPKVRTSSKVGSYTEPSADSGRFSMQFSVGSDWIINQRWSADAGYSLEYRADEVDQSFYISASRSF